MVKLYTYFRSTAAYRVRIALNLKGVPYSAIYINLREGHHVSPNYHALNPQQMVPLLIDGNFSLNQSLGIIDFLEEKYPSPSLYPPGINKRAHARAFAQVITSDIHPINNLRVLNYLKENLSLDEDQVQAWYHHWIKQGFDVLEYYLQTNPTQYCYGSTPTIADICLIPQVYNAERYKFDLRPYPRIRAITESCLALEAFQQASPEAQDDYVP